MDIIKLAERLNRAGLHPERIKLTGDRDAIRIVHDYNGPYPTKEAIDTHWKARDIANKAGYIADPRGYYTATYIYAE